VRYHLGYFTVSVPAGDYSRLEEAMNTVPDSYFYNKIVIQIGRCDTAEKKTEIATSPSTRIESIAGDVDRTIRSSNAREALKTWDEIYLYETNRLAGILYVPKLQRSFPGSLSLRTFRRRVYSGATGASRYGCWFSHSSA
jgi:hypothetical protein